MRILVIEDQSSLSEAISSFLKMKGHATDVAGTIREAELSLLGAEYSIVLLDLMLPDGSGMDLLKQIRRKKLEVGVLIMTAKDQISDRIHGLESGADDYLIKPFDLDEMYARVQAVQRRYMGRTEGIVEILGYQINLPQKVLSQNGVDINLTSKEWAILERIAQSPKSITSKDQLENAIYTFNEEIGSNTIEVYISQIRKKTCKDFITTARGLGYRLGKNET